MPPPFSNRSQGNARASAPSSQQNSLSNSNKSHVPFHVQPRTQNSFSNANHSRPVLNELPSHVPPGFENSPNHLLPLQSNHPTTPLMGSFAQPGQTNLRFAPQNFVPPFPVQPGKLVQGVNPVSSALPPAQFFGQNLVNLSQQLIQSMGFPNGQVSFPNPYQNMNQQMPLQFPNMSQLLPYGAPQCSHNPFGGPNQVPQNNTLLANQQLGIQQINQVLQQIKNNLESLIPQTGYVNASNPPSILGQQLQGTTPVPFDLCSTQHQGDNNSHNQPPGFSGSQGSLFTTGGGNTPALYPKNTNPMNFTRNSNGMASKMRFQQKQFPHMQNDKRKFGMPTKQQGKGFHNKRPDRFVGSSASQVRNQKRSLAWTYTEQEIQQWREQRRKNYPSGANLQKKLEEKHTDSPMVDMEARLRRKQLKEILAKQAELGVEVAEIPSHYLSDSEKQQGLGGNGRHPINGRYQNMADKRGRFDNNRRNQSSKKAKLDTDSADIPNKRKQTLLEKLLSSDINRDKSYLLQAFRFMVMNSFFKDWPDKPLKYPSVTVKENGRMNYENNEKEIPGNDITEACNRKRAEKHTNLNVDDIWDDSIDGYSKDTDENDRIECNEHEGEGILRQEEEEGEIID